MFENRKCPPFLNQSGILYYTKPIQCQLLYCITSHSILNSSLKVNQCVNDKIYDSTPVRIRWCCDWLILQLPPRLRSLSHRCIIKSSMTKKKTHLATCLMFKFELIEGETIELFNFNHKRLVPALLKKYGFHIFKFHPWSDVQLTLALLTWGHWWI